MHARHLLETFARAGLAVALTPDNGLKVTPARALTDDLRHFIRVHKAELVDYLKHEAASDPYEADRELIEERAAIMQYDGGMELTQAERQALLHAKYLLHHWTCKPCCAAGQGRGTRCRTGAELWTHYGLGATP